MRPRGQHAAIKRRKRPWDEAALARFREWEPSWVDQCLEMSTDPWTNGVLPRMDVELISIAVNAACTNLSAEGTRRHIQTALKLGATIEEIMEELERQGQSSR
jgi:alkylhydroperoxidase/carboxymuconolactone decarboxylase family protein YurZ